ncbi:FCD domain-containing protein [Pseudomonas sp. FFUP_PS_473]|jgi:GntR family carbon starvation induced transcriptional regulator|nr:GntR family transcriptional regulator [Pseudomonas sp. HLS-6]PLP95960.1 FCD domain-containing protein [Pseudomonas sp. FFUP_PS_473]
MIDFFEFRSSTLESLAPRHNSAFSGYERLKHDIIRGVFKPGEKLLMSGLKERYDLGVGPLREALSQLVAEHLVVVISQKGYRVASMSLQELQDIYDARANLEAMIVGLAIERGDDAWEAQVVAQSHTLSKVMDVQTREKVLDVWDMRHKAFHSAIAAGCGSKHLLQVRTYLFDQAERYRHLWLTQTVFSEEALEIKRKEHAALVEAILARDTERATTMMRNHLMSPVPIILEVMQREGLGKAVSLVPAS